MSGRRALPIALGIATFVALAFTQSEVGFTRDEGYYFTAGASYEGWVQLLLRAPGEAAGKAATERFWSYNSEHPGLAKLLFALSHLLFTRTLHWLPDAEAFRLPAWIFAGLLAYWLALLGSARSRAATVLAPLVFFCTERTFFHAHLCCFDIPICALNVGLAVQWARAVGALGEPAQTAGQQRARNLWLALVYGCALATKHNAWLWPPALLLHAALLKPEQRRRGLFALPFLLLSPVVLFATWPLLWHGPLGHLKFWFDFHLQHNHYYWFYLGTVLRRPPFPVEYPLALLAFTLPITTVALLAAALLKLVIDFARRQLGSLRLLELGFAIAAVLPFMLRTTPIFGGIKHWLAFAAFLSPEAAGLLVTAAVSAASAARSLRGFAWLTESRAIALGAAALLLPGLWQIAHLHPYGTSAYGELAGDVPGAASLGMQRQYWSNNVTAVLPWINAHAPPNARVFFHEVNFESYRAYQEAGKLRRDIAYANGPGDAQIAALQWHREFRDREPETWTAYGTQRPVTGLYLDETAQVVVYARPEVGR